MPIICGSCENHESMWIIQRVRKVKQVYKSWPMGHPQLKCPINDCTVESSAFRAFICTKISSEDLERRPRAKTSSEDLERRPRAKTSSEDLERELERRRRAKTSSEDLERRPRAKTSSELAAHRMTETNTSYKSTITKSMQETYYYTNK